MVWGVATCVYFRLCVLGMVIIPMDSLLLFFVAAAAGGAVGSGAAAVRWVRRIASCPRQTRAISLIIFEMAF